MHAPAVSTKRLSLTRNGQVRYELKTPYSNGTTHVLFEPLDIMYRMYGMPRAQEAQERPSPDWWPWCPGPESTSPGTIAQARATARLTRSVSSKGAKPLRVYSPRIANTGRWSHRSSNQTQRRLSAGHGPGQPLDRFPVSPSQ